jgi:hypothetical protein
VDIGYSPDSSAYIGSSTGKVYYCDGIIDDVRIYDRALSTAEIQNLYNADKRWLLVFRIW